MKIAIKDEEYKLYHNLKKGTVINYNNEECVVAENNLIVGIYSGNVYKVSSTKKIMTRINRAEDRLKNLPVGSFFIWERRLYLLINRDIDFICYCFNEERIANLTLYKEKSVQDISTDNIQIKIK